METHEHNYEPVIDVCTGCGDLRFSKSLAAAQAAYETAPEAKPYPDPVDEPEVYAAIHEPIEEPKPVKVRSHVPTAIRKRNERWVKMNEGGMSVQAIATKEKAPYHRVWEAITETRGKIVRVKTAQAEATQAETVQEIVQPKVEQKPTSSLGRPIINAERDARWVAMRRGGMTTSEIAKQEGTKYQTVWAVLIRRGVVTGAKGKTKFTYARKDAERWAKMNKTMTLTEIATAEGREPWIIRAGIIDRLGRKVVDHRRERSTLTTEQAAEKYAEAIALYEGGMSQNQIAVKYGVSRERVRQWFNKAGLQNVASERRAAAHEAKVTREAEEAAKPRICPRCGEEYMPGDGHTAAGVHAGQKWGTEESARYWDGVAEDYKAGMKLGDITAKWNISAGQVMRSIDGHNIPHRRPTIKRIGSMDAIKARKVRIRRLNEQGFTNPEIAEVCGCSTAWVRLVLNEAGLSANPTIRKGMRHKRNRTPQGTFAAAS